MKKKNKPPPTEQRHIDYLNGQYFQNGDKRWNVAKLVKLSECLKPFKIPMAGLNVVDIYPSQVFSTAEFVTHIRKVKYADLRRPIILSDEGLVMDGRHRVMRAMLDEKKYILAVRFTETPEPCITLEDD